MLPKRLHRPTVRAGRECSTWDSAVDGIDLHSADVHAIRTLIYSHDPAATRAFLRDVLDWLYVEDPGSGAGLAHLQERPSEMGVHPTTRTGARPTPTHVTFDLAD